MVGFFGRFSPADTRLPARSFCAGFSALNFPRVFLGGIGHRIKARQITEDLPIVAPGFTSLAQPRLAVLADTNQGQTNQEQGR